MAAQQIGEVLLNRFARLHHATNLRDFAGYCSRRALLSRRELTNSTADFTAFYSDASDKQRGVWERVFGNLEDFGGLFWASPVCIPNAYGPITLVFERSAWGQVSDVAVTRKNAATKEFELATERMSAEELESCFELRDKKWWQLTCNGLEVSLGTSFLSLDLVEKVVVEPVSSDFLESVRRVWTSSGYEGSLVEARTLWKKPLPQERLNVFVELVKWSAHLAGKVPLSSDLKTAVPPPLKEWASRLRDTQWAPLRQWLEYTFNGSLR